MIQLSGYFIRKDNGEYAGKIIKGIAGFYYVYVSEAGVYECKAKGVSVTKNKTAGRRQCPDRYYQ